MKASTIIMYASLTVMLAGTMVNFANAGTANIMGSDAWVVAFLITGSIYLYGVIYFSHQLLKRDEEAKKRGWY